MLDTTTAPATKPYYQIVREIVAANVASGNIPAGTRLLTSALADRLGVSRPPVRRALQLLEQDGIVSELDAQGYVVGHGTGEAAARTNLHQLHLDLPESFAQGLGKASWERIFEAVEMEVMNSIPFGTYQISEAAIGDYFDVSRTVVRDVLSRMDARGLISKDRSSHWIAGPLGARMLDEAHEVRRLLEPSALASAVGRLPPEAVQTARQRLAAAMEPSARLAVDDLATLEHDLHAALLQYAPNRRLLETVRQSQIALTINRLFALYIGVHDESAMLREHALVLDHVLLGDAEGAAAASRFHLDADHGRARARLKVLSVFDAAAIAPYLSRMH